MGWLFGRKTRVEPEPILAERMPKDDERLGPAPPPPRTAHAPRVSVRPFAGPAGLEVLAEPTRTRPSRTLVLRADAAAPVALDAARPLQAAAVALGDALLAPERTLAAGDLFFAAAGERLAIGAAARGGTALLVDVAEGIESAPVHVRRDDLAGRPFPGVTGIRAMRRTSSSLGVRLGPPPGARWVLVGLRSFAVFHGKLIVVDGEEPLEVRAGELAVVAEPTATLYLSAGNDAALAIGFASPDLVVALG